MEARWREAFGFVAPSDEEQRRIGEFPWEPQLAFVCEARLSQLLTLGQGHAQPWEGEPPSPTLCDWLGRCAKPAGQCLAQERIGWEFLEGVTAIPDG